MEAIKVVNVSKQFTGHRALNNVSISVPKGSVFGLLGPNGAGKTTLIRIINRIIAPDSGEIYFQGRPILPDDIQRIGYLPEERGLYKKMKVGEQAIYLAQLKGLSKNQAREKLKPWFEKFDLTKWWDKKVEELSKGMQQKLQFIVTVLHDPELLIFDEPFSGFDPINVNLLKDEILRLKESGATVIFSTHNMASVEELCDHIALINRSEKILDGPVFDIKHSFKENIYELIYTPALQSLRTILPSDYHVIEESKYNGLYRARIKIPMKDSPNILLQHALQHVEVHGLTEILPSMNEIFISSVKSYNPPTHE